MLNLLLLRKMQKLKKYLDFKMLMFAKTSFVYYMVDVFVFPNDDVKHIFSKLDIIKCYLCLTSTDTDSASLQFIFICKVGRSIIEDKAR